MDDVLTKVLAKRVEERYQHVDELIVDLRALNTSLKAGKKQLLQTSAPSSLTIRSAAARLRKRDLGWAMLCLILAVACTALYVRDSPTHEGPVRKWSFAPDDLSTTLRSGVISPNGEHIAYLAGPGVPSIWVRDLDNETPRRLAGTEGVVHGHFWSPDSHWIGFHAGLEVRKISVDGGPAISVSHVTAWGAGTWSPDGETIAFGSSAGIHEVASSGGEATPLFQQRTPKGSGNYQPHFLPLQAAARSLVLTVGSGTSYDVVLTNLETDESVVLAGGAAPVYSKSGHVLYEADRNVWALPFDLSHLQTIGDAFLIAQNGGRPSVSDDGTLVYIDEGGRRVRQLVWRDRQGNHLGKIGQPQPDLRMPSLSPDGHRVAAVSRERGDNDVWVHETIRPIAQLLTTDTPPNYRPQWSPDGRAITFTSRRDETHSYFVRTADGTGDAEPLVGAPYDSAPFGWSRDGDYLIYETEGDLGYLKRKPDGEGFERHVLLDTRFKEASPQLSPNGRFIAYCSNQSGLYEIYVRSFPSGGDPKRVSSGGGLAPRWSRDSHELFYVAGDTLMAVEVSTSPVFEPLSTTKLFHDPNLIDSENSIPYDVSADGRFVTMTPVEGGEVTPPTIHVVEDWYEEFRDREQD